MNAVLVRTLSLVAAIWLAVGWHGSAFDSAHAGEPMGGHEEVLFDTGQARILGRGGQVHDFFVELAQTPAQQRRGLMFRDALEPGHGMLFDFNPPRRITMWMKNTPLSLDMLFFDPHGRLILIAEHTEPFSQELISAPEAVRYVLEVSAGTAANLGLELGDLLRLP